MGPRRGSRVCCGRSAAETCPWVSCLRGSDILTRLPGKGLLARLQSIPQRRCYRHSSAIAAASGYLKRTAEGKGVSGEKIFVNSSGFDFSRIADYHFDPQPAPWANTRSCAIAGRC